MKKGWKKASLMFCLCSALAGGGKVKMYFPAPMLNKKVIENLLSESQVKKMVQEIRNTLEVFLNPKPEDLQKRSAFSIEVLKKIAALADDQKVLSSLLTWQDLKERGSGAGAFVKVSLPSSWKFLSKEKVEKEVGRVKKIMDQWCGDLPKEKGVELLTEMEEILEGFLRAKGQQTKADLEKSKESAIPNKNETMKALGWEKRFIPLDFGYHFGPRILFRELISPHFMAKNRDRTEDVFALFLSNVSGSQCKYSKWCFVRGAQAAWRDLLDSGLHKKDREQKIYVPTYLLDDFTKTNLDSSMSCLDDIVYKYIAKNIYNDRLREKFDQFCNIQKTLDFLAQNLPPDQQDGAVIKVWGDLRLDLLLPKKSEDPLAANIPENFMKFFKSFLWEPWRELEEPLKMLCVGSVIQDEALWKNRAKIIGNLLTHLRASKQALEKNILPKNPRDALVKIYFHPEVLNWIVSREVMDKEFPIISDADKAYDGLLEGKNSYSAITVCNKVLAVQEILKTLPIPRMSFFKEPYPLEEEGLSPVKKSVLMQSPIQTPLFVTDELSPSKGEPLEIGKESILMVDRAVQGGPIPGVDKAVQTQNFFEEESVFISKTIIPMVNKAVQVGTAQFVQTQNFFEEESVFISKTIIPMVNKAVQVGTAQFVQTQNMRDFEIEERGPLDQPSTNRLFRCCKALKNLFVSKKKPPLSLQEERSFEIKKLGNLEEVVFH